MNFHGYSEEKLTHFRKIQSSISNKEYAQAINYIENNEFRDPLFIMAEAQCYMKLKQTKKAKELYNKTIVLCDEILNEKNDAFILNIKGNCNLILKKYSQSIECYNKALLIDDKNAVAICFKSVALFRLNEIEAAYDCLSKLLEIDSENTDINLFKAYYLNEMECYDDSLKLIENVLNTAIHPQAYLLKADALFEKGKMDEALTNIEKALKLDSNNSYSWYLKAEIEMHRLEHKKALNDLKKAVSINDNIDNYWFDMGSCYLNLGEYNKSYDCYKKAFNLNPHSGGVTNAEIFLEFIKNIAVIGKNLNFN